MATYYKWRKSTFSTTDTTTLVTTSSSISNTPVYYTANEVIIDAEREKYSYVGHTTHNATTSHQKYYPGQIIYGNLASTSYYKVITGYAFVYLDDNISTTLSVYDGGQIGSVEHHSSPKVSPSTSQGYVYSANSGAYPNGGVSSNYYYDQRTTVTSPTNPSQISYPSTINSLSATITWQPATSNTSYPVSRYEVSYSTNGGSSWQVAGTTTQTSYQFGISSPEVTQIQFRVRAMDTNSQYSDYVTGSNSTVQYVPANPPVLVLPNNAKLGDTITISWNSVTDATNYILQRKVDCGEWTQIYSGAELSTTNLVDNLGISYRIAFNVGSNFTSEWSQEYRLNTYEKLIEMTYLGEDGNYMPLYPRTISNAVVNASDLINTVSLSGTYQGTGIESNIVLLNVKEGIEPKIAFVSNTEGNVEIVNNFDDNGNLVVDNNSNVAGEEYSYVVIGKKED